MQKQFLIFSASFIFIILSAFSIKSIYTAKDTEPIVFKDGSTYQKEWVNVDKFEDKGLPKSALKLVNQIYKKAKKENNIPQVIKSVMYQIKITNSTEDDGLVKSINRIEQEIKITHTPIKQILYSINAELYYKFFQKNKWKIFQQTALENNTSVDINTWGAPKLSQRIVAEYKASLSEEDSLQRISIQTIEPIILSDQNNYQKTWPTIYDFVAYRAIQAFSNDLLSVTTAVDNFTIDKSDYFLPTQKFINLPFDVKDSLSLKFQALKIVQDLVRFHTELENPDALIDVELFRLKLVYQDSKNIDKDELYIQALENLLEQYQKIRRSDYIRYEIAEISQKKASRLVSNIDEKEQFKKYNNLALQQIQSIEKPKQDSILLQKTKNLKNLIYRSNLNITTEEVILPNENFPLNISTRNIENIKIKVLKINEQKFDKISEKQIYGIELYQELEKASELISSQRISLKQVNDFQQHSTDLIMDGLKRGFYILEAEGYNEKGDTLCMNYSILPVSNLSFLQRSYKGNIEIVVMNRKTGTPMPNVNVHLWSTRYSYRQRKTVKENLGIFVSDKDGSVVQHLANVNNVVIEIYTKDDQYSSSRALYIHNPTPERSRTSSYFFTDRAIYRPGQTIYFKAITLSKNAQKKKILKDKNITISFYDANYQKVSGLKLKTNEFGSVNGSFVIPTGILTGQVQLQSPYGSISLRVEEYKRTKFVVNLDDFSENYQLNKNVNIQGSAIGFSGENISNAKYKYRVFRKPDYSYYWQYSPITSQRVEIKSGEGIADDKGVFKFDFIAKAENLKEEDNISYNYQIIVDVTDITGETHSITKSINIGTISMTLNADIPNYIFINQTDSFNIYAKNLNGEIIPAKVNIELYKMQTSKTMKNQRLWSEPDFFLASNSDWNKKLPNLLQTHKGLEDKPIALITESSIETKKAIYWQNPKSLKEGYYKLKLSSKDTFGKEVVSEKFFVVIDSNTKEMPTLEKNLFKLLTPSVEPGQEAKILIGSSFSNVKVLLEISKKNQPIEKRWLTLNNSKQTISIPVTEKDRGNIKISTDFVYENRTYHNSSIIRVPYTNRKLDIEFETFRNKLYPGQKEEWRIKIKGHKGEKIAVEFLASMYDASLDQFTSRNWDFNILDYYYGNNDFSAQGFGTQNAQNIFNSYKYYPNPSFSRPHLNWFDFNTYVRYYQYKGMKSKAVETAPTMMPGRDASILLEDEKNKGAEKTVSDAKVEENTNRGENDRTSISDNPKQEVQIRKNFDETAFFFPNLKTNKKGDIVFSFIMSESLTKWNFRGFAHTQDLKYGFINKEIYTQKDLMVIPNSPRFFREGDEMEFPIKVSNLSKKTLNIKANIRFYNALTSKEITNEIYPDHQVKEMTVKAGESSVFKTHLIIPEGYQTISYKVIASADNFSDGEEKAIPVLSNRILVTESLPLHIRGKGVEHFTFNKLLENKSKTLKNYNYTLEMTSNPAWYAVQSLPYLTEYPYECAEQTFSRFYANALAAHIATSNPRIKAVFDTWRNTPKSESLLSNLEKNQELKSALLQETPWVMDAQDETEQKRRIAMLFDLNNLAFSQKSALRKLQQMQVASGAWPWFKGMRENRYITQLIVSGMGHLRKLNVLDLNQDYQTKNIIISAIRYLDDEIANDYKKLKNNNDDKQLYTKLHTNQMQIQYLYARSFFNDIIPIPNKSKKAIEYFTKNSQDYWTNQSQYIQAMIALTALRQTSSKTENNDIQNKIVASLKEYALHSKEMGMYWKQNTGYYWYQAPIEKQALMIELFSEIGNEDKSVEDLKVWLLKQKQTQNWKTTRATADAIYALLMNGTDILSNDELVKVSLGGETVKLEKDDKVDAGTGYYKKFWKGKEIKPEMGNITISKQTDGVAWGAVYWQYFEDLDKITEHKTPLNIEKELFIENNTANGPQLKAIEESKIKVGDKIVVRIILKVDRAMEYVHLKDMRASGFEPINVMSGYHWKNGLGYYESTKDASTNFFFDNIQRGTYVFEYSLRAVLEGDFSNGISNIQCMYAPEFTSHSEGIRVKIEE